MQEFTLQDDFSFSGGIPQPPYKVHDTMVSKMDENYMKFFDSELSENANILYTHRVPLAQTRAAGNTIPGQSPLNEMSQIFDIEIPRQHTIATSTVPARVFIPKGDKPEKGWPLMVWFHGGGWTLGGLNTENSYCTKLAEYSACIVVSVDYRMAPEYPFPACVDDSMEALWWGFEVAPKEYGIDNSNIAVGGCSAGGNLTGVVTHKFASSPLSVHLPAIKFQLMVVPVIDNTATPETHVSWKENEFTPQLPAEKMLWYRRLYLPNGGDDLTNPDSSPLFFSNQSFSKVPPCFIAVAECDVLKTEAEIYAEKLKKNNVKTTLVVYPGVPHSVLYMDASLKQGADLVKDTTSALKDAFYSD